MERFIDFYREKTQDGFSWYADIRSLPKAETKMVDGAEEFLENLYRAYWEYSHFPDDIDRIQIQCGNEPVHYGSAFLLHMISHDDSGAYYCVEYLGSEVNVVDWYLEPIYNNPYAPFKLWLSSVVSLVFGEYPMKIYMDIGKFHDSQTATPLTGVRR